MTSYIAEAQKERESWLANLVDSNSNPGPGKAGHDPKARGISAERSEIISDNVKLLCQKIRDNPTLDPSSESVQFVIVKILACQIE